MEGRGEERSEDGNDSMRTFYASADDGKESQSARRVMQCLENAGLTDQGL